MCDKNFVCTELSTLITNCFMGPAPLGQNYDVKLEMPSSQALVADTALLFLPPPQLAVLAESHPYNPLWAQLG